LVQIVYTGSASIPYEIIIIIILSSLFFIVAVFQLRALKSRKEVLILDIRRNLNLLRTLNKTRLSNIIERSELDSDKILHYLENEEAIKQTKDISFEEEDLQREFSKLKDYLKSASIAEREQIELYINQCREELKYQKYLMNPSLLNTLGLRELDKIIHELNAIYAIYSQQRILIEEAAGSKYQKDVNSLSNLASTDEEQNTYRSPTGDQDEKKKFFSSDNV
jgi:hypothetical protein